MCGICGYIGKNNNAFEVVMKGLKELEYRGYDSWGVAGINNQKLYIHKKVGRIGDAKSNMFANLSDSNLAIGHSRWATHGSVTEENAHPHTNPTNTIAVVHNGIIENFEDLRNELINLGKEFKSETDTEVIPYLIDGFLNQGESFEEAVKSTIRRLEGRYAIVAIYQEEYQLVAARSGSPLIVGKGKDEIFIASDVPAFFEYTRDVNYLDDNQMVVIDDKGIKFIDLKTNKEIEKRTVHIEWEKAQAEKGKFSHFMMKEIMEQKDTIFRTINQDGNEIKVITDAMHKAFGTYFVGCGTAGKVCLAGSYIFAEIANKHVNVTFGSEFPSYKPFIREKSLLVAVSQSGETADTLEAISAAKEKKANILSIINVAGSTIARESDFSLNIKVGPEIAVASTKATTAQLAMFIMLAYSLADRLEEGKRKLIDTAGKINDMLNPRYEEHILDIAKKIQHHESMYVIGKGVNYPMALESAIKLQEVSYIHAEGFAGGELKHGPIALISEGTPCIVLVANDETKKEILSNAMEIKSRGGYIIGVCPTNESIFDEWIKVPDVGIASCIVNIIPIQILAYKLAVLRKNDPDKPRNLAKSVTVK